MIHVTIEVDPEHNYRGIRLSGHAGLAEEPREGQEIVCAAVSALTLNMANSVERFTGDRFTAEEEENKGVFDFRFTDTISSGSKLLMDSLVSGLTDIEEAYGEPFIRIRFIQDTV